MDFSVALLDHSDLAPPSVRSSPKDIYTCLVGNRVPLTQTQP